MTHGELNNLLLGRAEEVCQYLLPQGKKKGNEWQFGDLNGGAGKSGGVVMSGSKAGSWADFADSNARGRTLVSLWCQVRCNDDYPTAADEIKEYLGVKDDNLLVTHRPRKIYSKPSPEEKKEVAPIDQRSRTLKYLEDERGLPQSLLLDYKVCARQPDDGYIFCYYSGSESKSSDIAMFKHVFLERDEKGKKRSYITKDSEPVLFGKGAVSKNSEYLIITAGELDAISWAFYKHPSVSIPMGINNNNWVENDWEWLDQFATIYINYDSDPKEQKAARILAERLGLERCKNIQIDPYHDANQMLTDGEENPERFLEVATDFMPADVELFSEGVEELIEEMKVTEEGAPGFSTPWIDKLKWRIRPGEVTAVVGYTGHGKALGLNTLIPTPLGLREIRDLTVGDQVIGDDGLVTNITHVSPVFTDHDCFKITFDDGTTVIADADHRWKVETVASRMSDYHARRRAHIPRTRTNQLKKKLGPIVINTRQMYAEQKVNGRNNFSIPLASTVAGFPSSDMLIAPYTLGAWLGDGASAGASITCHISSKEILDEISAEGYKIIPRKDKNDFGVRGLIKGLRAENLIKNKHIPEAYFQSDQESRMSLLQGLMDTDGYIETGGRSEFCSTRKGLAEDVLRLVRSLGIKATICEGDATIDGRFISKKYRVMFTTDKPTFRLPYKLERVNKHPRRSVFRRMIISVEKVDTVETKCIAVDNDSHLFLCTESNIITHNTAVINHLCTHLQSSGARGMIASLEMKLLSTKDNFVRCYYGQVDNINEEYVRYAATESHLSNMLMVNREKKRAISGEKLLEYFAMCTKKYGLDYIVLDNLMMCKLGWDDFGAQQDFVENIQCLADELRVHVFVVAHPRKPPSAKEKEVPPDIYEIKGAGELANLVDNCISVWRNTKKHMNLTKARQDGKPYDQIEEIKKEPDSIVQLGKQRAGVGTHKGWVGSVDLWCKSGMQFHTSAESSAINYSLDS